MVSSQNPQPSTYGPRCGGHDAMSDAHNCRQQQNQQQTAMAKGGAGCKTVSPQAPGGADVNSPHNNASNANGLTESLNQSRENASYDKVGNRNVDNSAGPGGGSRKKRTRKHHKTRRRRRRGGEEPTGILKNIKKTAWNVGDTGASALQGTTKIASTAVKRTTKTVDIGIDRSFDLTDGALNATKIVSSTLDQTGNIGKSAVDAIGDTSTSALSATGKIAKTTFDETGNNGSKLVGTIVKGTFKLPNDLLVASGNLWTKVKDNIKKKELGGLCNERIKVIQLTMREINKMLNIDSWVKKITKDGENEGWIPKCGYIRCSSGRKSIIIVIRSILHSVLFQGQGKQLNNLTMLKINFEDYSDKMHGIKKQINLVGNDVSYDSKKTTIINDLNNLNTDIKKSFTQFLDIVRSMRELATPEIFKLRASISQKELDKQLSKMSTEDKNLYESVIAPKPLIDGANTTHIQEKVDEIKEDEGKKLQEQIAEVKTEMKEQPTGGKSKKRTRKYKKRRTSQKSRRRKVYVGCNRRSRKRMGGKTSKLNGWGCMSGGKRKTNKRRTKKGGDFLSSITKHIPGTEANKAKKLSENTKKNTGQDYRSVVNNPVEAQEFNKDWRNLNKGPSKEVQKDIDEDPGRDAESSDEYKPLTPEEKAEFWKQDKGRNVSQFTSRKNKKVTFGDNEYFSGGKRKTRKFKKHYMWNTKGKRYMAKTYKQHLRGKKLGHTHTKPKKKSKKTRKTRRTRRRGGDMTPGGPEHTAELRARRRARQQGFDILKNEAERNTGKKLMMKTMAKMEQQNMNQRHSIGPGSELNTQSPPVSRNRAYTRG